MKPIIFYRESNDFTDILQDITVKKGVKHRQSFTNHLILVTSDEKILTYLMLKFGNDVISMNDLVPDRSPVMYKDYTPIKKTVKDFIKDDDGS